MNIDKLKQYCKTHLLKTDFNENLLILNSKEYEIIEADEKLFDEDFNFLPEFTECEQCVYEFCGRWYIQEANKEVTMQELIYIGEANQKIPTKSFLGIHSGNELMNGIGKHEDWIKKAKFLGIKTLGICEKHTLAGVIEFQNLCKKNGIKPVFGMSVLIKGKNSTYNIKLYVKNFKGWMNILKFNEIIQVDEKSFVEESFLLENLEGLIPVLDPKTLNFEEKPDLKTFYQLDTVVFGNEEEDVFYANNLEKFLLSDLEPVAIFDAYYLEQNDWEVREALWKVGKAFDSKTKNQYFKNNDQYAVELINLFENENKSWIKLFKKAVSNLDFIVENCNFEYDTVNRRLPKYEMTEEEKKKFKTNEDFFMHLIKKGFEEKGVEKSEAYINRLKEELRVLKKGDVLDYFLILHDIIQAEKKAGGLVGFGRGSAGGSAVSYLLDIIQIDPLGFDLLFERFLNDGRMGEMKECKAYKINDSLTLNEGTILRVKRGFEELVLPIEELKEGDEILKYN